MEDEEPPLWLVDSAPSDIFFFVMLCLPVDVLWKFQRVCTGWRSLLVSDVFWASYCARMKWDYREGLRHEAESEAREIAKAKKHGVPRKRKSYISFIGLQPLTVRFWARRKFLQVQRDKMYDTTAMDALRDTSIRRGFGQNVRGFLDCVLSLDEHFAPALNKRALLSFDEGHFELAKDDLEVAVKFNPYFSDAISNLGLAYHELGDYHRAFKMYSVALSIEGDEISFNNRGLCLNDMGKNEQAIEDFMTILTHLDPGYTDGYNNMAYSKNCLGRFEEAIVDCSKALELEPHLAEPHRIRAYAYYRLGRFQEAVADATIACELFGSFYAKAHYTRGLALMAMAEKSGGAERESLESMARTDLHLATTASPNVANEL